MSGYSLPIGFRFEPTKLEFVQYFLAIKNSGQELPAGDYPQFLDYDVYTDHPFNILASTKEKRGVNDVNEGYFFCRLNKVTPKGKRFSRCIKGIGTWWEKSSTNEVRDGNNIVVGIEKYLKFKPDEKSNTYNNYNNEDEWMMHEYHRRTGDDENYHEIVLCRINRKPSITTKRTRMIMPIEYEAGSSSKRGRFEYEQQASGSGCINNSADIVINNPNQDYHASQAVISGYQDYANNNNYGSISNNPHQDYYVSQGVMSGYHQDEYCVVPQANNDDSALIVEASDEEFTKEIDGLLVDDDDKDNNQVEDGILQLQEEAEHMEGVSVSNDGAEEGDAQTYKIKDIDQFVQEAEQAGFDELDSWIPTAFDDSTNAIAIAGFDDLLDDVLALPTFSDADINLLLQTPFTAA